MQIDCAERKYGYILLGGISISLWFGLVQLLLQFAIPNVYMTETRQMPSSHSSFSVRPLLLRTCTVPVLVVQICTNGSAASSLDAECCCQSRNATAIPR